MHDAHFHWSEGLTDLGKLTGIVNAASPKEYAFLKDQKERYGYFISAGIHPWYADQYDFDQFEPLLREADFIGEVGMDSVWCEVPFEIQKDRLLKQLALASTLGKPVILHTKGRESEVLDCIRAYPNTYLVHWYSCMEYLEDYIRLGCYFTVGISVGSDEAVSQLVRKAPADKLLLETDGIDAVAWAKGGKPENVSYFESLRESIAEIAKIRGTGASPDEWEHRLDSNFRTFINR